MIKNFKLANKSFSTKIIIKNDYINKYLDGLSKKNSNKIFCIVDQKVKYVVKKYLNNKNFLFIFIKCGEEIKNINNYNSICEKLLSQNVNRKSILISIGGGTLGDLCGFVASTILRGISFRLIPTTLLSQVDSSIGGKNGVNTIYGKNLIGSFYQPDEVLIDPKILKTLSIREIKSGYSEIIKHALIKDINFFKWLDSNYKNVLSLKSKFLEKAITKSIIIKLWYVNKDPKENLKNSESRGMLNFGHTIGHSLETFYNYNNKLNHGEAISVGMITESLISNKLGYLDDKNLDLIFSHFKKAKLKMFDKNIDNDIIIKNIIKDKKNSLGKINIVLLKDIGKSFFKRNMELKIIKKILKEL